MIKKIQFAVACLFFSVAVQAAVTKCVITNVPSASGDVHAVITCLSGDVLSNVRFGYTMLNGVPVGGNLTNYVNLAQTGGTTVNRRYTGAVGSPLPAGGSYWYWVEGKVGSGSVTNFCGQLLNQWRYWNSYGVALSTSVSGTDWNSTPKTQGTTTAILPWHKYAGWRGTNLCFDTLYTSVDLVNTNGAPLVGLCSPVLDSGMSFLSFKLAWKDSGSTNNVSVYVVTNDLAQAGNGGLFATLKNDPVWIQANCLPVYSVVYPGSPGLADTSDIFPYTNAVAAVPVGRNFLVWFVRDGHSTAGLNPVQLANLYIRIHEVQIVPPTAEVAMGKADTVVAPANPYQFDPIRVQGTVQNKSADWPTVSRNVKFWYKWMNATNYSWIALGSTDSIYTGDAVLYTNSFWQNSVFYTNGLFKGSLPPGPYTGYFTCDYTGWSADTNGLAGMSARSEDFSFNVGLFPSDHGVDDVRIVDAAGDAVEATMKPVLVGTNTWRFPIETRGVSEMSFRFETKNKSDFRNLGSLVDVATNHWGENNRNNGSTELPTGGNASSPTDLISLDLDNTPMVMAELNTDTGDYLVSRVAYQDFDEMNPLDPSKFSDTMTSADSQKESTGFDVSAWTVDSVTSVSDTFSGLEFGQKAMLPSISSVWSSPLPASKVYTPRFVAENAGIYFRAGITDSIGTSNLFVNLAAQGQLYNVNGLLNPVSGLRYDTVLPGIDTVSFDYSPMMPFRIQTGMAWNLAYLTSTGYEIVATAAAPLTTGLAPASISVIGLMNGNIQNFYEVRASQTPGNSNILEIYRWQNGSASRMGVAMQSGSWTVGSSLTITARFWVDGSGNAKVLASIGSLSISAVTDSGTVAASGTFGVYSANCISGITATYRPANSNGDLTGSVEPAVDSWYYDSSIWTVSPLRRKLPKINMAVEYQTLSGTNQLSPSSDGWVKIKQVTNAVVLANSLTQRESVSVKRAPNTFFRIKSYAETEDAGLAIDNLSVASYRGTDQNNDPIEGFRTQGGWVTTNRPPVAASSPAALELTLTRADSSKGDNSTEGAGWYQWLLSPQMTNGLGTVTFSCFVTNAPAVLRVQYAVDPDNGSSPSTWVWNDVRVYSNDTATSGYVAVPSAVLNLSRAGLGDKPGRFRIVHDAGANPNASVRIDDVKMFGFPPPDGFAWRGYNLQNIGPAYGMNPVLNPAAYNSWDGTYVGILNNTTNYNTSPDPFYAGEPYLKAPEIPTGLGSIYFQARMLNTNSINRYASFNIEKATEDLGDFTQWTTITNITLSNLVFQAFSVNSFDLSSKMIRFAVTNPAYGQNAQLVKSDAVAGTFSNYLSQVLFEDVMITEPLRPSYVIGQIELNLDRGLYPDKAKGTNYHTSQQPVVSQPVKVDVKLSKFLMGTEITSTNVYVTWRQGTNNWGDWSGITLDSVNNLPANTRKLDDQGGFWFSGRLGGAESLLRNPSNIYDNVVQYCVWSVYGYGTTNELVVQAHAERPVDEFQWYYPTNTASLSTRFAPAWTPYYWLYSCPPFSAWLNEINTVDFYFLSTTAQFLEIAAPQGIDLRGWKVAQVDRQYVPEPGNGAWVRPESSVYADGTFVLDGLNLDGGAINTVVNNNPVDGYAFFTLGNATEYPLDYRIPADKAFSKDASTPWGMMLYRDNGAFEAGAVYYLADSLEDEARTMQTNSLLSREPLQWAGYDDRNLYSNSLSVVSGAGTNWLAQTSSPQAINDGQTLPQYDPEYYSVFASRIAGLGTQNGSTAAEIVQPVMPGYASDPVLYKAAVLHRIGSISITTNLVTTTVDLPVDAREYQLPALSNLGTNNATVVTTFVASDSINSIITNATAMQIFPRSGNAVTISAFVDTNALSVAEVQNMRVFVTWTNAPASLSDWGVSNWLSGALTNNAVAATNICSRTFELPSSGNGVSYTQVGVIPADVVGPEEAVRYCVWAIIKPDTNPMSPFVSVQEEGSFVNPPEYDPVDLNLAAAAVNGGWSPYYINFSTVNSNAWINEVNLVDAPGTDGMAQFFEVASLNTVDFSFTNWTVTVTNNLPDVDAYGRTFVLERAPVLYGAVSNVLFYVLKNTGAFGVTNHQQETAEVIPVADPLTVTLNRPSGVLAHSITLGFGTTPGTTASDTNTVVGSAGLMNDLNESLGWQDSWWGFAPTAANITPGAPNHNQQIGTPIPIEQVMVSLSVGSSRGRIQRLLDGSLDNNLSPYQVPAGTVFEFVATANSGYLLDSIMTNSVLMADLSSADLTVATNTIVASGPLTTVVASFRTIPGNVEGFVDAVSVSASPLLHSMSPGQPLIDDRPTIDVTLTSDARYHVNQGSLRLYVSWTNGVSPWGVAQWWNLTNAVSTNVVQAWIDAGANIAELEYDPSVSDGVRFFSTNALPIVTEPEAVIQYYVWGIVEGVTPQLFKQTVELFVAPDWYRPLASVELNTRYAAQVNNGKPNGFSPYYYVYGTPVNEAWFNEINTWDLGAADSLNTANAGYVEICVPAISAGNTNRIIDLGGWTIVEYKGVNELNLAQVRSVVLTNRPLTALPMGRALFTLHNADMLYPPQSEDRQALPSGARFNTETDQMHVFKLFRSNGAYEAGVVYLMDGNSVALSDGVTALCASDPLMIYAGTDWRNVNPGGALQLLGSRPSVYEWNWTFGAWTPGTVNSADGLDLISQVLPMYPDNGGFTAFYVNFVLNIIHPETGLSSVHTNDAFLVDEGLSLDETYALPPWYRVVSTNLPASAAVDWDSIRLYIPAVSADGNYDATIAMIPSLTNVVGKTSVSLGDFETWLSSYSDGGSAPSAADLELKYWLNADPNQTLQYDLGISNYAVTNMTAWLSVNGLPQTTLNPPGALLVETNRTLSGVWGVATNATFFSGTNTVIELPLTNTPSLFYRTRVGERP